METAKLYGIDPLAYLGEILARLAQGHPINRIAELLPWRWSAASSTG
ncbi:MAG: transposase domain-containing protein [Rhodospirillales bacterium]